MLFLAQRAQYLWQTYVLPKAVISSHKLKQNPNKISSKNILSKEHYFSRFSTFNTKCQLK